MNRIANRVVACALACCSAVAGTACLARDVAPDSRAELAALLRDSVGRGRDVSVSFLTGGGNRSDSHLYVTLDTAGASAATDSAFALRARSIARFAVRHYDRAASLESVTVATRHSAQSGTWKILNRRAFAVAGLGSAAAP